MKSKICYLLILTFSISLFSCSDDFTELKSEHEGLTSSFNEDGYYVSSEGVLCFNGSDAFFTLGERLVKMTNEEFRHWEAQSGFKSLLTELENVNTELDSCNTIEEYNAISEANSDIITIEEDYFVVPVIENPIYQCIINRNGYYCCENRRVKVGQDGVFSSKLDSNVDWCNFEKTAVDTSVIEYIPFFNSANSLKSTNTTYTIALDGWAGWADSRNAYAKMYIFALREESGSNYVFKYYAASYTTSYGRKIFGGVKRYKSHHYCKAFYLNVKFPSSFDTYLNNYRYTEVNVPHEEDDQKNVEQKIWWTEDYQDKSIYVGTFTVSKTTFNAHFPNYYINTANGEFWTSGTSDRHIILSK
ncbi:MAG: hypothetical protein PF541_03595 [Prolixibacteraceae bacterium]|jgi:hypothetical protein|nr:hypothetical protein [Prolixibacteraceae bacterium]